MTILPCSHCWQRPPQATVAKGCLHLGWRKHRPSKRRRVSSHGFCLRDSRTRRGSRDRPADASGLPCGNGPRSGHAAVSAYCPGGGRRSPIVVCDIGPDPRGTESRVSGSAAPVRKCRTRKCRTSGSAAPADASAPVEQRSVPRRGTAERGRCADYIPGPILRRWHRTLDDPQGDQMPCSKEQARMSACAVRSCRRRARRQLKGGRLRSG